MITWAQLEGFALGPPEVEGQPFPDQAIRAIEVAQDAGHVDSGILAHRRAVAVDAARRLIATRP